MKRSVVLTIFLLISGIAHADQMSLWKYSSNTLKPVVESWDITTTGKGVFGELDVSGGGGYVHLLGTGENSFLNANDGTWLIKLIDTSLFSGISTSSAANNFYCRLQNASEAAQFGDSTNIVYLADDTYAVNASGPSYFTDGSNSLYIVGSSYALTDNVNWYIGYDGSAYFAGLQVDNSGNLQYTSGIYDGSVLSIDTNNRHLYASDGSTVMLDWSTAGTAAFGANSISISKDPANSTWFGLDIDDTSGASPVYGNAKLGVMNAADSTYSIGGLWFGADTPSFTNYAFMGDGSAFTLFNTPAGAYMAFRVGNATKWSILSTGNLVSGADGTGTQAIVTKGNITASNESFSSGAYALRSAGGNPAIQVDFERASGGFAGNFFEIWASDTTSAATARLGQVGLYGNFAADPGDPTAVWIYFSCTNSATAYADAPLLVLPDNSVRINGDNTKLGFGAAGIADSYILYDSAQLEFYSVLGGYDFTTAANVDLTLNFIGTTNSGQLKWMEDENYFQFGNKFIIPDGLYNNPQMSFASDTNSGWYYGGDGVINWSSNGNNCASIGGGSNGYFITGANEIKFWRNAADDLRIDVYKSGGGGLKTIVKMGYNYFTIGNGTEGIDYTLTFDGETNDGVITWMEDEDYFNFADTINTPGLSIGGDSSYIFHISDGSNQVLWADYGLSINNADKWSAIFTSDGSANTCYLSDGSYGVNASSAYIVGDCSANTFTDRTPAWTGTQEEALKQLVEISNTEDSIDHSSLPEFTRRKIKEVQADRTVKEVDGRDIGATITMLVEAIKALEQKTRILE